MKRLGIPIFLIILFFLSSCGTIKEGFTNQKKKSTDEFLVEKKSPLVMPPNFNELPIPNQTKEIDQKKDDNFKSLITENTDNIDEELTDSDIQGSILSKIKSK